MLQRGYAKQVKEVCNLYIHEMELLQIEKELEDEACRESLRVTNEERKKLKAEAAQIRAPERKIAQQEFREILVRFSFSSSFPSMNFSVHTKCSMLFDGHNGTAATIYAKENLLNNILSAIPSDLNRDEWIAALSRALVAKFVKTDKDFQQKEVALDCCRGMSAEAAAPQIANVCLSKISRKRVLSRQLWYDLKSEVVVLKAELDRVKGLNVEHESKNKKLSEDLAAAEAKMVVAVGTSGKGDYIKGQVIGYMDQFGTSLPVKVIRNCNKITTSVASSKTFYTDSNGRDFIKRIRDYRKDWKLQVNQLVAGNYYPINLGIYLKDKSKELSILVDRSVGGSSIKDGQLELIVKFL
ncbi:hypothetical protein S83_067485 [Arachis hypogaea]